jgi:UDP-GlcNAc3NAcA epimerase
MLSKKLISVVGARPQFVKHAILSKELNKRFVSKTIHTGQHHDSQMSGNIFADLGLSNPDWNLEINGGRHGEMTGRMIIAIEQILLQEEPDGIILYGDTNSTLAGAVAASKLGIPIFHVEAGVRSGNYNMPEEVNRVLTDAVADLLFAPSNIAVSNLERLSLKGRIVYTGDIMKDLILQKSVIDGDNDSILLTLHRPYNCDEISRLKHIMNSINNLNLSVIFPAHPRTRKTLNDSNLLDHYKNIKIVEPLNYSEIIQALSHCKALITDSGGMQKEAYWLRKKCITIRSETEWSETLIGGWNILMFNDFSQLKEQIYSETSSYNNSLYGNGKAAELISEAIVNYFEE